MNRFFLFFLSFFSFLFINLFLHTWYGIEVVGVAVAVVGCCTFGGRECVGGGCRECD
jgi:hypothetical protein